MRMPTSNKYVDPLLKKEVFTMEIQVFQNNTLKKVGVWSRGYVLFATVGFLLFQGTLKRTWTVRALFPDPDT